MNDKVESRSESGNDLQHPLLMPVESPQPTRNLPTLTKAELAELLFEQVGLNKREAKDMVESFFEEIRTALERGEMVKLSGFGNFVVREKKSRVGRNPQTGQEIEISARRVLTFRPSQVLKNALNASAEAAEAAAQAASQAAGASGDTPPTPSSSSEGH